jgi:uncharacterized membrane protein
MYTIIGGDGKEYGPVSAEQVRSWLSAGRANLQTKIKDVGGDTWKTIAEYPEILNASPAGLASPTPAAGKGLFLDVDKLDIISCYERSWNLLKANFWSLVGASFLMTVIGAVIGNKQFHGVLVILFGGVLTGGMYYYFLRKVRGQPATIKDLFAGFSKVFASLVVAALVMSIFAALGLICIILPGIYLIVSYSFTYLLIVDRGLGFWEAMETSRKVITRQWWRVLGLLLLAIPFFLAGLAALIVGIFVALPLITGALVYAYEDLCNPGKPTGTPGA